MLHIPPHLLALVAAITFEVIGTSALQASQQFTRPVPSVITVAGYGLAFYFLSVALKAIPVGVAYAMWSGLGIVLIALIGLIVFGQRLDAPAVVGLAMIIGGVAMIQLFSKTAGH